MIPPESGGHTPSVEVYVHEDHSLPDGVSIGALAEIGSSAIPIVLARSREGSPLTSLAEVEVTLVSDATIAEVHVEFMGVEGATDVITFDHGEIVISTDTAAVQGKENGNSIGRETALYLIHGLLHLAGYSEKEKEAFETMARLQEEILCRVWDGS